MASPLALSRALAAPPDAPVAAERDLLRFITCGSVDDGKSTLIGRLLHDGGHLHEDQLATLAEETRRHGTQGEALDLALALDGLAAEREQGITIDVAYRYFATARRSFIVADTPGHEEYTRNMATGASTADAAILLVDVTKGLTRQTRRHAALVAMLGIRHVAIAANKMDLAGFAEGPFAALMREARAYAAGLGLEVVGIPLSALTGDNVVRPSEAMGWHRGPHLLGWLEGIAASEARENGSLRLSVQGVARPDPTFRGYTGIVTGGPAWPGQAVTILPSGARTRIARIVTYDGDLSLAVPGQSVTLTLADETDVSRGSVIAAGEPPRLADRAVTRVFWMAGTRLAAGARILAKIGTQSVSATIASIDARIRLEPFAEEEAGELGANDIGTVTLAFDRPVALEPYAQDRDLGGMILMQPETFDVLALGLVQALPEAPTRPRPALGGKEAEASWLASPFNSPLRSVLKAVSWRLLGTILTVAAAFALTGDARLALVLGGIEILAKFALYFGHERIWARIGYGLRALPSIAGRPPAP